MIESRVPSLFRCQKMEPGAMSFKYYYLRSLFLLMALRLVVVDSFFTPNKHQPSRDVILQHISGQQLYKPLFLSDGGGNNSIRLGELFSEFSGDLKRVWSFSGLMIFCGALLGPFLKSLIKCILFCIQLVFLYILRAGYWGIDIYDF